MSSGTISLTLIAGALLEGQILWSSVSNGTEANSSQVTATLQVRKGAYAATLGSFYGTLTVGGVSENWAQYLELRNTWQTVKTITATVYHSNDGTGSCYLYGKANGPSGTTMAGSAVTGSQTVTLDTIPRYAVITGAPNFTDEDNPTITYSNPAGNAIGSLQACISLTGAAADIDYRDIPKNGNSYTFQLTEAERTVLRNAITSGSSTQVIFFVQSSIGGTTQNSILGRTLTLIHAMPTLAPTVADSNSTTAALTGNTGKLIRYHSNAAVTFGAVARKGAAIVSRKVTCGAKSLTADGTITNAESGTFLFSATDSRGNVVTETVILDFVNYVKLTCNLANKTPDAAGNLTVSVSGNCFNGSFGAVSNTLSVKYRYKTQGGSYGSWQAMTVTKSGNTYTASASVTGLDYQTTYVIQAYAADKLETAYSSENTVKATPVFDWGKDSFRFNVPVTFSDGSTVTSPAPGGYGLGAIPAVISDCNAAVRSGWYRTSSATANQPLASGNWIRADAYGDNDVYQVYYYGKTQYQRYKDNGTWSDWDCIAPPMGTGTEYRTVERWKGVPVYCKLVSLGALPNASEKAVAISGNVSQDMTVIGHYTYAVTSGSSLEHLNIPCYYNKTASNHVLVVKTDSNLSAYNGFAIVQYVYAR